VVQHDLAEIFGYFQINGQFVEAEPCGSGHIHDTYVSTARTTKGPRRFIHQRINRSIFQEPEKLMENIERVTGHIRQKVIAAGGDPMRECLNIVLAKDGHSFHRDAEGNYWRTFVYIEGARTYDVVENLDHVYNAAKAFGDFQMMLTDLPDPRLHETIPGFHDTKKRFRQFTDSLMADVCNRASGARNEIEFAIKQEPIVSVLVDLLERGETPERITHNDTKFNNVLIDDNTDEAICVIDLDTVMPGLPMYDFGDSVRLGAATAPEDERNLSKVSMSLEMFEQLTRGYLDATRDFLLPVEINHLTFSAKLITLEMGLRFLADHLAGDVYYKVHRDGHNLDRCRTQFKMVRDMERKATEMEAIVSRYS